MVRGTAAAVARRDEGSLTEPTFLGVLMTGLPGFLREGFLPLGAFYAGLQLDGLAAGIVASGAASLVVYLVERRAGRNALLVRLSLAFVAVQSIVGLVSNSTTVYLAQPVLIAFAWGVAFLVSAALGRPLAGTLAGAWYPVPHWLSESPEFKRVFGGYFLARSALRLAMLLQGSLEGFLVVVFLTGTPVMLLILAWSIRFSLRGLADAQPVPAA
jgi:hypothetical protein